MALKTTNFGLIKPELTDAANITAFNENWDKIDEQLLKAGESGGSDLVQTEYDNEVSGDPPIIEPVVQNEIDKVKGIIETHMEDTKNPHDVPVNNNILINSNFTNPVNQRGFTSKAITNTPTYTIDRWYIVGSNNMGTLTLSNEGLNVKGDTSLTQLIPVYQKLENLPIGKYALSTKINGKIYTAILNWNNEYIQNIHEDGVYLFLSYSNNIPTFGVAIDITKIPSANIEWVKLELGEVATPYVPRLYAEEYLLCQRYYQILYLGEANLWQITANYLAFAMPLHHEMRTTPTVTFPTNGSTCLAKNGVEQSGFTFEAIDYMNTHFGIKVSKSSHGLTADDIPTIRRYAYADAEL